MENYDIIKYCPSLEITSDKIVKLFGLLLISIIIGDKQKINRMAQSLISNIEKFDLDNYTDISFPYKKQWQLHQLFSAFGIFVRGLGSNKFNKNIFYEDKAQMITHLSHIIHQIQKGDV